MVKNVCVKWKIWLFWKVWKVQLAWILTRCKVPLEIKVLNNWLCNWWNRSKMQEDLLGYYMLKHIVVYWFSCLQESIQSTQLCKNFDQRKVKIWNITIGCERFENIKQQSSCPSFIGISNHSCLAQYLLMLWCCIYPPCKLYPIISLFPCYWYLQPWLHS